MKKTSPTYEKPQKAQIRLWESLGRARIRRKEELLLAEGFKVVRELMNSPWKLHALILREDRRERWLSRLPRPHNIPMYILTEPQWRRLSQDSEPEGIMALASPPSSAEGSRLPEDGRIILTCGINNPNNLGALMRTAHWFGFSSLLLSANSADFMNPKVVRTSMGSIFHLNVFSGLDFAEVLPRLKKRFFIVAGSAASGLSPHPCPGRVALLMGSESHGIPENILALADETWHIAGSGGAESLSLPQAAAIMMYEASRGS